MKYDVKVALENHGCGYYQVNAPNKNEAVSQALKIVVDSIIDIPHGKIWWEIENRKWMTAKEGLESMPKQDLLWGFYNNKVLMCGISELSAAYFLLDGSYWYCDSDHQPSHVMLRIEGEEPPESPVIEKTLYEKIEEIYNKEEDSWLEKQIRLSCISSELWNEAVEVKNTITNEKGSEYSSRLICDLILKLAKEKEKLAKTHYINILKDIANVSDIHLDH